MNIEQLDGFLAALICGPEIVRPSEYLPVIWGGHMVLEGIVRAQPLLQDFLSLIMRHWNAIADTLHSGEVFLPLLIEDEDGITHPTIGRLIATWNGVSQRTMGNSVSYEEHGGWLIPIFALATEHHPRS